MGGKQQICIIADRILHWSDSDAVKVNPVATLPAVDPQTKELGKTRFLKFLNLDRICQLHKKNSLFVWFPWLGAMPTHQDHCSAKQSNDAKQK